MLTLNTTGGKSDAVERSSIYSVCVCARAHFFFFNSVQYWPLEEEESALAAWCKQEHACGIFVDDSVIREKALQIGVDLGVGNFAGSDCCLLPVTSVT